MGPFKKYEGNPILHMNDEVNGVGHHSFLHTPDGELVCVYHSHYSKTRFTPRTVCIDRAGFEIKNGEEVLVIHGPTRTEQPSFKNK